MNDSNFISDSNVSILQTRNKFVMKAVADEIEKAPNVHYPLFRKIPMFAGFGHEGEGIMFTGKSLEYFRSILPRLTGISFVHKRNNSFHDHAIGLSKRFPHEQILCEYLIIHKAENRIADVVLVEYIGGKHSVTETITNPDN